MSKIDSFKKKILYRANYRGTKEMDILLSNFVKKYINDLNQEELEKLYEFLNISVDDLMSFYQNRGVINFNNERITELFKKFKP